MLTRRSFGSIGFVSLISLDGRAKGQAPPVHLTSQEDLQRLMGLLHITELRRGANGRDPHAPNAANYDEAKANPYPDLPDPLVTKSGKKVTTASAWWKQRRPEIVEDFDAESTDGCRNRHRKCAGK